MTPIPLATADLGMLSERELAALLTYSVDARRRGRNWRRMFGPYATLGEALICAQKLTASQGAEVRVTDSDGRVR